MTVIFVGGLGRNAQKAIKFPELWKMVSISDIDDLVTLPEPPCVQIAGLGSRLTESVIRSTNDICSHYILVKPFAFEKKDALVDRCLSLIPSEREVFIFDNQSMADENSKLGIADFQKSLFEKIESKLQSLSVL
jgi:hypothetical protein